MLDSKVAQRSENPYKPISARAETMVTAPHTSKRLKKQRCLVSSARWNGLEACTINFRSGVARILTVRRGQYDAHSPAQKEFALIRPAL